MHLHAFAKDQDIWDLIVFFFRAIKSLIIYKIEGKGKLKKKTGRKEERKKGRKGKLVCKIPKFWCNILSDLSALDKHKRFGETVTARKS